MDVDTVDDKEAIQRCNFLSLFQDESAENRHKLGVSNGKEQYSNCRLI